MKTRMSMSTISTTRTLTTLMATDDNHSLYHLTFSITVEMRQAVWVPLAPCIQPQAPPPRVGLTLPTYTPESTLVFKPIIHSSGLFPTRMIHHLAAISTLDINARHSLPVMDLRHNGSEDKMSTTFLLPSVAEVATLLASDTTASSAGTADRACARLHPHSIATFSQRRTFSLHSWCWLIFYQRVAIFGTVCCSPLCWFKEFIRDWLRSYNLSSIVIDISLPYEPVIIGTVASRALELHSDYFISFAKSRPRRWRDARHK